MCLKKWWTCILAGVYWSAEWFFFPSLPSLTTSLVATDRLENSRVEGIRESEHARDVMVSSILWHDGDKCVCFLFPGCSTCRTKSWKCSYRRATHLSQPINYAELVRTLVRSLTQQRVLNLKWTRTMQDQSEDTPTGTFPAHSVDVQCWRVNCLSLWDMAINTVSHCYQGLMAAWDSDSVTSLEHLM